MSKKQIIIIVIIAGVLIIGSGIAFFLTSKSSPTKEGTPSTNTPNVSIRTDKDTGEQISSSPGGDSESQDATAVTLLGVGIFYDHGLTRAQILFIKTQLLAYSSQNLSNKYSSLTVRPQDYVQNGDTITTTIRQGETDNLVNLTIASGTNSGTMQLTITDSKGTFGGNFTSPATPLYAE